MARHALRVTQEMEGSCHRIFSPFSPRGYRERREEGGEPGRDHGKQKGWEMVTTYGLPLHGVPLFLGVLGVLTAPLRGDFCPLLCQQQERRSHVPGALHLAQVLLPAEPGKLRTRGENEILIFLHIISPLSCRPFYPLGSGALSVMAPPHSARLPCWVTRSELRSLSGHLCSGLPLPVCRSPCLLPGPLGECHPPTQDSSTQGEHFCWGSLPDCTALSPGSEG